MCTVFWWNCKTKSVRSTETTRGKSSSSLNGFILGGKFTAKYIVKVFSVHCCNKNGYKPGIFSVKVAVIQIYRKFLLSLYNLHSVFFHYSCKGFITSSILIEIKISLFSLIRFHSQQVPIKSKRSLS